MHYNKEIIIQTHFPHYFQINSFVYLKYLLLLQVFILYQKPIFGTLSISPQIMEVELRRGATQTFTLVVTNGNEYSLDCSVSYLPMKLSSEGLPESSIDTKRSCSLWVTSEPLIFNLGPKASQTVKLNIKVPVEAVGGYYCLVLIDGKPPKKNTDNEGTGLTASINFSFRSSVVILASVLGGKIYSHLNPTNLSFTKDRQNNNNIINLPIRNDGNIHAKVNGKIHVKSEDGQIINESPLTAGKGFILPEHERLFSTKSEIKLPDGVYLAEISLVEEHSKVRVQRIYPFFIKDGTPSIAPLNDETRQLLLRHSLGFGISTTEVAIEVRPGSRKTQAIQLINMTKEKIPVEAVLSNWIRNASGDDLVTILDSTPTESFLSLRQTKFELPPLGKRQIPLLISLPKDKTGESFAAVTFNRTDRPQGYTPFECARRSALVRMISTGTLAPAAEITSFTINRKPDGILDFKASVKNTGNSSWEPDFYVDINTKSARNIGKCYGKVTEKFRILPSGTADYNFSWNQILQPGSYTAQFVLNFDPNKPPARKDMTFEVPAIQGTSGAAAIAPAAVGAETDTLAAPLPQSATQAVTK